MSDKNPEDKQSRRQRMIKADLIKAQIEEQRNQLAELKKRLKEAENYEKRKIAEQRRKDDTRRKILVGSCILEIAEKDETEKNRLMSQLEAYLTEKRDRILFGFPVPDELPESLEYPQNQASLRALDSSAIPSMTREFLDPDSIHLDRLGENIREESEELAKRRAAADEKGAEHGIP